MTWCELEIFSDEQQQAKNEIVCIFITALDYQLILFNKIFLIIIFYFFLENYVVGLHSLYDWKPTFFFFQNLMKVG